MMMLQAAAALLTAQQQQQPWPTTLTRMTARSLLFVRMETTGPLPTYIKSNSLHVQVQLLYTDLLCPAYMGALSNAAIRPSARLSVCPVCPSSARCHAAGGLMS